MTSQAKPKKTEIISASRRTDVPSNPAILRAFLGGLAAGIVEYGHPMFGTDVEYVVSPEKNGVISWWSKNFKGLLDAWTANPVLLSYGHHFTFTINGGSGSPLEPGLSATLPELLLQLSAIVDICRGLGQKPDDSIMVHVDPIVVYRVAGSPSERDNLDHLPALFSKMRELGLSRIHVSFLQLAAFPRARKRLREMEDEIVVREISEERQVQVFGDRVLPHLGGIRVQTCTAAKLISAFPDQVKQGACVGWRDVASITKGKTGEWYSKPDGGGRHCTCYPHRDVGDKAPKSADIEDAGCVNSCIYCFSMKSKH
jgi:hypothetical protein